ncbi:hypothetical protein Tco_1325197 [Tanacetum coccineum]
MSRLSRKKKLGKKESVSKQGRKNAKPGPTLDAFDADLAHGMDYMETEEAVKEGRQSNETEELNLDADTEVIAKEKGKWQEIGTADPTTSPTTTTIFNDEEMTLADTLVKMKDKKAKDKGKCVLEESEPKKKMTRNDFDAAQVARDAEVARQLEVEWQAEVERERQREEQASMDYISNLYDEVQAGIDADALFAAKLQQEEREEYIIKERAKFLAETIAAQRKFKAAQRAAEIRSRPPTKSQLKIQAMYERQKKIIDDFKPMDSDDAVKDSKKAAGKDTSKEEEVLKESDRTRVEVKLEASEQDTKKTLGKTVKMKARKKGRKQAHDDTDVEHDSKEDERKTESINKEDAEESTEKGTDASKKRKGGPRIKRQSKRKKLESDLEE